MKRVYSTIFLVSSAVLVFEISITRLFSIYLSYHFAFMVISIAMLGIGSAGTVLSFHSQKKLAARKFSDIHLSNYALCAGVSIVISYIISNLIPFDPVKLSWDKVQILYFGLYSAVLSVPFFFSGMLIAYTFMVYSGDSERIYCSDLIGAGAGSISVIVLLNISGPDHAVIIASTICLLAAFISGSRKSRLLLSGLVLANAFLLILNPAFMNVRISPYKHMPLAMQYPGAEHIKTYNSAHSRVDTLKSPSVRFAPGLSLNFLDPLPAQIGISVDGGEINAVTEKGDRESLKFLEYMPSSLAYYIGKSSRVLVLEPKGGLQVLIARRFGADEVFKVESNPLIVRIIREDLGEFSGDIFKDNTFTGYGRTWLKGIKGRSFDIIDLPVSGTSVTGIFGVSEDYRFTVEAFKEYLNALGRDGLLSVSLYIVPPPRREFRLLTTIVEALEESGVKKISDRIIAVRSWGSMTILSKNTVFSHNEITKLKEFSRTKGFDLVYYPGIKEYESNIYIRSESNEYFEGFKGILDPAIRSSFISEYLFDIAPVHDENPFFNYYMKLKNVKAIYEVMGRKWLFFIEEGYILPVILVITLFLSLIMILLPVLFYLKKVKERVTTKPLIIISTLVYFGMLGAGFMFVEITLIQKIILALGSPVYSVAVVLSVILISSGTGSILSGRVRLLRSHYILFVLTCIVFLYSIAYPILMDIISSFSVPIRILLICISLFPVGFLMGIPFSMGIKILGKNHAGLIPLAWAVNACLSVITPVLSVMLALELGFRSVLWLGSLAYLSAFISLSFLPHRSLEQRQHYPSV
jgi:hypothetical protein